MGLGWVFWGLWIYSGERLVFLRRSGILVGVAIAGEPIF